MANSGRSQNEQSAESDDRSSSRSSGRGVSRRQLLSSVATAGFASAVSGRAIARSTRTREGWENSASTVSRVSDEAWVETTVDTDDSGVTDRIYVRVTRPAATEEGEQVPVIVTASPYYAEQTHGDTTRAMLYDRRRELSAGTDDEGRGALVSNVDGVSGAHTNVGHASGGGVDVSQATAGHAAASDPRARLAAAEAQETWLEDRYVSQGYATARVSTLGTHKSTGCYTAAGPETAQALASVVDWFNGRATAYDAQSGGATTSATWTNGKTGMIGISANGELANAVATTGVDGLEAIVPQSANNGQYSLFRSNGTPISVVPKTSPLIADLSAWVEATNLKRSDCELASRVADREDHQTGDYNDFWHEREFLPQADSVEAAVFLTHGVNDQIVKPSNVADWYKMLDRADVPLRLWLHPDGHIPPQSAQWDRLLDRWWEYWLKDVDNGVMDEDPVTITRDGGSESVETYGTWPVPDAEPATLGLAPGGSTAGDLIADGDPPATTESFVDDVSMTVDDLARADSSTNRLRYQTPPLTESVHVSGRVVPSLSVSFDDPTVVSAALVEYGRFETQIVTRGWADPLNRPRYGDHDTPVSYRQSLRNSKPIGENAQVRVEFPLQATDHVFSAGSRIAFVVYASDREFTLHPPGDSTVSLSLADSEVTVPVVGGRSTLVGAFGEEPTETTETETEDTATPTPSETTTTTTPTAAATDEGSTPTGSGTTTAADETETTSSGGPGFGLGGAAVGFGTAGYLLQRRLADSGSTTER